MVVTGNVSEICAVGSDNNLTEALDGRKPVVEGCDDNELRSQPTRVKP